MLNKYNDIKTAINKQTHNKYTSTNFRNHRYK